MNADRRAFPVAAVLVFASLAGGAKFSVRSSDSAPGTQETITRVSLVALLAPGCGCNSMPAFPKTLETIRREIRRRALAAGARYAAVGVVLSGDVASGVNYLVNGVTETGARVEFSPWDEVHAGDSWRNEAMLSLVWSERLVDAAFPQLVLIERQLERSSGHIRVVSTRQTLKLLGTAAFEQWVAGGMVLPDSSALASR